MLWCKLQVALRCSLDCANLAGMPRAVSAYLCARLCSRFHDMSCSMFHAPLESVTAESRLIAAPWFETSLTPELYYYDPREAFALDDEDEDEDSSMDTHSTAETVASTASTCMSCGSDGFRFMRYSMIPASPLDSSMQANHLAFACLQKGFISFGQLGELCTLLPSDAPRKHVLEHSFLEPRCFTTGAYVFGGDAGVRTSMRAYPWVARLLCSIVRCVAPGRPFSSVSLSLNQWSGVHVDAHNSRSFRNVVIPAGYWDGGELWVANEVGTTTYAGTQLLGDVVPVRHPYTLLDATVPHAVLPWTGERTVVCAFHIRDAWRLTEDHLAFLREVGFHVLTCECESDPYMLDA